MESVLDRTHVAHAATSTPSLPRVTCEAAGGAAGGPAGRGRGEVLAVGCRLYNKGPARLDVPATGYEPIDDQALSLDRNKRCEVDVDVPLQPQKIDAGK